MLSSVPHVPQPVLLEAVLLEGAGVEAGGDASASRKVFPKFKRFCSPAAATAAFAACCASVASPVSKYTALDASP
jgi:hypothetical protein